MSRESPSRHPTPERKAPEPTRSDKGARIALSERAKTFHGPLNVALVALLGVTNISGISHADIEETTEAQLESTGPEARHRVRARRIAENLGSSINERLAETASYEAVYAARRADIERRERRRGYVHGFESLGFSNEGIETVLNQLLPPEWLSEENVASISLTDAAPDPMEHYHMSGHAAAHCRRATDGHRQARGRGTVEVFRSWLQSISTEPAEYRAELLVYTLIHEVGHANDPTFSVTMSQERREEADDWVGLRVRNMQESHFSASPTNEFHHLVHQTENESRRWLGNRYAYPLPGEGSLPILYPGHIHGDTPLAERNMRSVEYYPEAVAIVATVNVPDAAYASDEAWEASAAQELLIHNHYRMSAGTERSGSEQADALEHVRFVRRLIPGIRLRNQTYHTLAQSGHLAQTIIASPPTSRDR